MSKSLSEYPNKFRKYVADRHRNCTESNQADHRPTYQGELDRITADCIAQYEKGLKFIATMADVEHEQCKGLYQLKQGKLAELRWDRYVFERIEGYGFVIVPAYVTQIEAARFLQPFFETKSELAE